ncbi:N-6 DNA methylase family protein, partial [Corynebacterium urealyticum]|uniref:Uncharacterized protein n=1 Tax=Corynebacterium urealyticum (strain ATCC 43042 / DSM 7109) TaxID=504474 RepID=B1VE11_CORU7
MAHLSEDLMYRSSSENWQVAVGFDIPRDTSRLMVDVLLSCDGHGFYGQVPARTVYSPAAGTGGILLVAKRAMEDLNPKIGVSVYSRELMAWPRQIRPHRLLLMAFLFFRATPTRSSMAGRYRGRWELPSTRGRGTVYGLRPVTLFQRCPVGAEFLP